MVTRTETNDDLHAIAAQLGQSLVQKAYYIAVAESCTGGLIAQTLTEIPGCSAWFERGFVTYSNLAKQQMLGVKTETLATYGAVSAQTALEMAQGVLMYSPADLAVAVTGIAGPNGGAPHKPVGTVFIAWCNRKQPGYCEHLQLTGDRHTIRQQTAVYALRYCLKSLD